MTTIEVRLEVVVQDPEKFSIYLDQLRRQGLCRETSGATIQSVVADTIASSVPVTSGLEVAFQKGTLL